MKIARMIFFAIEVFYFRAINLLEYMIISDDGSADRRTKRNFQQSCFETGTS